MHYKTLYKTCTNKNIHKISTKKIPNKTKLKIHIKKTKTFVKIKRTYKINSYVPSKQNHSRIQTIKNRFRFLRFLYECFRFCDFGKYLFFCFFGCGKGYACYSFFFCGYYFFQREFEYFSVPCVYRIVVECSCRSDFSLQV